ncbi:MAG: phosphoglycolate phosphatase [Rhodobiaceae bacterium]|nr:phosphoglycolate phosphatase [Rhodobiaceae bacterium]
MAHCGPKLNLYREDIPLQTKKRPTIVFDLDGTLIETAPDLVATTNAVLAHFDIPPVDRAFLETAIGQGARAMITTVLEHQSIPYDDAKLEELFQDYVAYYARNISVHSRPFPGLIETLDRLEARGFAFAVCTNKLEGLSRRLLDALDLSRRFEAIVGPDTLGVAKPDPAHLLGAIRLAGGDRDSAVMVGDSAADIDAARAAGVPSVAVTFGYTAIPARELGADRLIERYDQLPLAIDELLGAKSLTSDTKHP